jgi:hypothetical protein
METGSRVKRAGLIGLSLIAWEALPRIKKILAGRPNDPEQLIPLLGSMLKAIATPCEPRREPFFTAKEFLAGCRNDYEELEWRRVGAVAAEHRIEVYSDEVLADRFHSTYFDPRLKSISFPDRIVESNIRAVQAYNTASLSLRQALEINERFGYRGANLDEMVSYVVQYPFEFDAHQPFIVADNSFFYAGQRVYLALGTYHQRAGIYLVQDSEKLCAVRVLLVKR